MKEDIFRLVKSQTSVSHSEKSGFLINYLVLSTFLGLIFNLLVSLLYKEELK